jgi:hypothetical protein
MWSIDYLFRMRVSDYGLPVNARQAGLRSELSAVNQLRGNGSSRLLPYQSARFPLVGHERIPHVGLVSRKHIDLDDARVDLLDGGDASTHIANMACVDLDIRDVIGVVDVDLADTALHKAVLLA